MEQILECTKSDEFSSLSDKYNGQLLVVHFWAPWAPQCQQITDVMLELSKEPGCKSVKFVKIEAEALPEISQKYEIAAVPTVVLIKNKTVVDRINGANAAELTKKVQHQASVLANMPAPSLASSTNPAIQKQDLNIRLKELLNSAPVILFMKGAPDQPKCGFSKQITQILGDHNIKYKHFDILTDEEVRQGLKKYSDWPTYPQLYANGELLGGLDIVKELVEAGELVESLPVQENLDDRLKRLISQEKVMLFMKGAPDQPKCGFSKTTIGILNEAGVKYGHFDILQDEEVRQGLKTFSNWPTFPQLYVDGELVGGLDIIKELQETEDLVSTLKGE